jgi:hypothetical protein
MMKLLTMGAVFILTAGVSANPADSLLPVAEPQLIQSHQSLTIWVESQEHPTLANAAADLLAKVKETHYQHKTQVNAGSGVYDLDCSGFVDLLLKRFAPDRFAQVPIESGHARPRAVMYYQLLHGLAQTPLPGWTAVHKLAETQPGDIIAWELTPAAREDTGHVVIVAAAPIQTSSELYRVSVYDSSGIRHDEDTRPEGTSGVGKGTITFRVNSEGEPVAFRFNSQGHFHRERIAIGRIIAQ